MKEIKDQFSAALEKNQSDFGVELSREKISLLADYFELLQIWNPRLHLIAPAAPEEIAVRHVLESLFLLRFLPENASFADVGTGGGFPGLPCLAAREDLTGSLFESSPKKAVFLREAVSKLKLQARCRIINARFEQTEKPKVDFVTCRALDKFSEQLARIVDWAENARELLLFGGEKLRGEIERLGLNYHENLIPESEQRFIFRVQIERR